MLDHVGLPRSFAAKSGLELSGGQQQRVAALVSEIADQIVVMRHGRVVESGSSADVLSNPQAKTRELLDAVPSR